MTISFNISLNLDGTNSPNEKEIQLVKNRLEPIAEDLESKVKNLIKEIEDKYGIFITPTVKEGNLFFRFLVDPILSNKELFLS